MTDDSDLLRQYATGKSDSAFAELVRRHVDLVYSAAFRQVQGDHHRANEVTQMVFIDLARKASALIQHPVLSAWLHRSTRLASLALSRRDSRRQKYERAAAADLEAASCSEPTIIWENVGPVLDAALDQLAESDRQAILLRYFFDKPYHELGCRLNLTENAARMRVERALEKLRCLLKTRGINSSSTALVAALAVNAVLAAPPYVALSAATAAGGAGIGGTAWIAFMTTAKLPIYLTAAVLIGGAAAIGLQEKSLWAAEAEQETLVAENKSLAALGQSNRALAAKAALSTSVQDKDSTVAALRSQVHALELRARDNLPKAGGLRRSAAARLEDGTPIFDVAELNQRPAVVLQQRPVYPEAFLKTGASGQVMVDFVVGVDGNVYNLKAISSSDPGLEDSALQSVSQWQFKPGQVGGQNVPTHMQVPIEYSTSDASLTVPAADANGPKGSSPWF